MSTYLACFIVCDFQNISKATPNGIMVRCSCIMIFALSDSLICKLWISKKLNYEYPVVFFHQNVKIPWVFKLKSNLSLISNTIM